MPRPAWTRIGTRRSAATANSVSTPGTPSVKPSARGCSLMPTAPASRQRSASARGSSRSETGSIRQKARKRPPEASAAAERDVVELRVAARLVHREGDRVGRRSSRAASSSSSGVCLRPSGSFWPMWVWTSKSSSGSSPNSPIKRVEVGEQHQVDRIGRPRVPCPACSRRRAFAIRATASVTSSGEVADVEPRRSPRRRRRTAGPGLTAIRPRSSSAGAGSGPSP